MAYLSEKFGFLAGSFFEAFASIDTPLQSLASLPPQAVRPLFYSIKKGGEKILCNPSQNSPKYSPDKPLLKKIWVLTYLLSEHKFLFLWLKALQSYPNFALNLSFFFNRGSPVFLLTPIFTSSKSPSSPILLAFCYSIGIKNLIRRMQNVRLAMSAAVGTCGDYAIYRTEGEPSKAKPQIWRENHAEHLSEPGIQLHSSESQTQSLNQR